MFANENYGIAATRHGLSALTSVVPVDLKLIVEHITAQTYSEWDLELRFEDQDWTVVLVGYHIQSTSQSSLDLQNGVSDPSLSRSGQ